MSHALSTRPRLTFRLGTRETYAALAHHHYRARPPATFARVIAAYAPESDDPIGVLVVSMPVLNAAWRARAFPRPGAASRYCTGDRRADAMRLNADVRTISRVIVEPRYRGLGVATALVRRYLRDPPTPITEAVGAMGAFSRFFEAAGMTRCVVPPLQRDIRLADALAALGVEPWRLADPSRLDPAILESPLLRRELRRWAQRSHATRRLLGRDESVLLRHAARIFYPPAVFVWVQPPARSRS